MKITQRMIDRANRIVSLVDVDRTNFPNFALMKIAAFHKKQGDEVEWYSPLFSHPDRIYASKIFTFTADYVDYNPNDPEPICGGTGYDVSAKLPDEIDRTLPDYSIYPDVGYAIGFLSRGCIRSCPWCVVPKKEGRIQQYDDIERISQGRKHVVLMDNNFLANEESFIREQLEKSVRLGLRIDFNQGLDARLVNEKNARWLARCKWKAATGNNAYIRFSCDTQSMIHHVRSAVLELRSAGYKGHVFVYFLARDLKESLDRIKTVLSFDKKIEPYVMPYRDFRSGGALEDPRLRDLARWCNMVSIRKSISFEDYKHSAKRKAI